MANVTFYVQKKSNPAHIYARFMAFDTDLWAGTRLLVDPKHWNAKAHRMKNTKLAPTANAINTKLDKLKVYIIEQYSLSQATGQTIDKRWLEKTVLKGFNRPEHEVQNIRDNTAIYFTDFMQWWCDNLMPDYRNPKSRKTISERRQSVFKRYVELVRDYEKYSKSRITLSKMTPEASEKIMEYFEMDLNYGKSTIGKYVTMHNFFCDRAIENDRILPRNYKCLYQPNSRKKVLEPFLNEEEIQKIYEYDFSDSERLDAARDNFIIGLCTGLRVSDFLRSLKLENIKDDFIEIRTQKTKTNVAIPVHWMIQEILKKRFGLLPPKISDQKFNLYIKEICVKVGIDTEMEGYLFDKKTKRKKIGIYAKHKLISSHTCRRSFVTNNFGKIPDNDLQKIGGWSTANMMYTYLKKSSRESAIRLKETWDRQLEKKRTEQQKQNKPT